MKKITRPRFSRPKRALLAAALFSASLCALPHLSSAQSSFKADFTDKVLQVAIRTFGFAYDMPKGDIDIEIVYNPNNPASADDARHVESIIAGASRDSFANRSLKPVVVPVSKMGSSSRLAYITHGMQSEYEALFQRAKDKKMLTFSTDFQCVDSQKCVMGVAVDPSVKIEISRTATSASQLEFSQALKLMVREVE